ncbi:MAG TPA: bifunctional glutamate N-acetyltransferase/amino-acid acetyltransferase ArgJ [Thermomicrobiales bacterium]|nr:bifunctional glutamate N-acetyltransferase/amino-acid acetyltransferase ArgJ [Thermomicrobiales bacterium]
MPPRSPLAPAEFPQMPVISGVRLGATSAGIKYKDRTDLLLVELDPGTTVAGVLTRSLTASAPVDWCRIALPRGRARAIIVNSGNANAFTGQAGEATVDRTVRRAAELFECLPEEVFVSSTGVIGEPIDPGIIPAALDRLKGATRPDAWAEAAAAIMTTDTFPKGVTRTAQIGEATVRVNGIVKGSGMIAPDMATMLGYIFTDAAIPANVLQTLLTSATDRTFNCITVDSDTSTSDTVLLCATGQATHRTVSASTDPHLQDFRRALDEVCLELAHQVVRDGEGATKFVSIRVDGAASDLAARRIGLAIANSPLVKTAIAGEDANWGRIVMAVGKSGEKADRDRLSISIGGVQVAKDGKVVEGYDEEPVARHMKGSEIDFAVDVGVGRGSAQIWTCDLTHGYIDINGSYRS